MEPSEKNLFELHVDHESSAYLSEAAKWGKFLSIVGFVFCGLFVLAGVFAGTIMSSFIKAAGGDTANPFSASAGGGAFIAVSYTLGALLYFFPCLYLYRFSTRIKVALRNNDQRLLGSSFANLKSYLKFLGILTLISLVFCALAVVIFIVVAAVSLGR